MYGQRFFASKVGLSALVSIAAMVAFNLFALSQQAGAVPGLLLSTAPLVALA